MNILECLNQPLADGSDLILADGLFNVIAALILVSVVVVAIFAPLVRARYRARVQRVMGLNQVHPRPDGWWQGRAGRHQSVNADSAPLSGDARIADGLRWEYRLTRATVAAWIVFILVAPAISAWSNPAVNWVSNLEFALVAGLLSLGPALVNLPPRWHRKSLIIGGGTVLVVLIVLGFIEPDTAEPVIESEEDDLPDWVVILLMPLIAWVYLSLFRSRIRGQVIPLTVVLCTFILALVLPLGYLEPHTGSCLQGLNVGASSNNDAASAATLGLIGATLCMLALWVALKVLGLLATGIERGWLSDLSMVSLVGLAVISAFMVFGNAPDDPAKASTWAGWLPILWMIPPLAVYILVLGNANRLGLDCLC